MDTDPLPETLSSARRAKLTEICQDCAAALDVLATIIVGCRNCRLRDSQDAWADIDSQPVYYGVSIN